MAKVLGLLCMFAAAGLLTGCATVMNWGNRWDVTVDTNPPGRSAMVTVKDAKGATVQSGITPLTVRLKSGAKYFHGAKYTIEVDGAPTTTLDTKFNGWYIGNILIGGLIGLLIVDPLTGAMWRLPDTVTIDMDGTQQQPSNTAAPYQ